MSSVLSPIHFFGRKRVFSLDFKQLIFQEKAAESRITPRFLKADSDKGRSRIPTFESLGFCHVGHCNSTCSLLSIPTLPRSLFYHISIRNSTTMAMRIRSQSHLSFRHSASTHSAKGSFLFRRKSFLAFNHSDSCHSGKRLSPIQTAAICHSDKSGKNCRRKSWAFLKIIRTNTGITPGNRPAGSPGFRCSARRCRHTSACGYRGGRLIFGNASPVRDSGLFSAAAFSSLSSA